MIRVKELIAKESEQMGWTYKYKEKKSNAGRPRNPKRKGTQSICLSLEDFQATMELAKEEGLNFTQCIENALKYYVVITDKKRQALKELKETSIKELKELNK